MKKDILGAGLIAVCASALAACSSADDVHELKNPPLLPVTVSLQSMQTDKSNGTFLSPREINVEWIIKKSTGLMFNPTSGKQDQVELRSYTYEKADQSTRFIAPTLVVKPGDKLKVRLINDLPANDPSCTDDRKKAINIPHCFNSTNLHTHGFWISPDQDNVFKVIAPGTQDTYTYDIPNDHPAGTFWYHPHLHGSTAIQVASGMGGALIIEGERKPALNKRGDLDTLLKSDTSTLEVIEQIMVLQQIQYGCGSASNAQQNISSTCLDGKPMRIENYDDMGPSGWQKSGRHTSINGFVWPTLDVKGKDLQRLRVIHAGVRDTINLKLVRWTGSDTQVAALRKGQAADSLDDNIYKWCNGAAVEQFMVATDGLTLPSIIEQTQTVLQPGYRADLLVSFPDASAKYCLIDEPTTVDGSVNQTNDSRQLLAIVNVRGENSDWDPVARNRVQSHLIRLAKANFENDIAEKVIADLQKKSGSMSLDRFTAHQPILEEDLTTPRRRHVEFNIDTRKTPAEFQVDGRSFSPDRVDQTLELGAVEEWVITSALAGHPFHIHVNPFEIIRIENPQGVDVSGLNGPADTIKKKVTRILNRNGNQYVEEAEESQTVPQYRGLKGAYKDTIFVKPGYKVVLRSHYKEFVGDFVLHCHILDHEDQGMMQYVRIHTPGDLAARDAPTKGHGSHANSASHKASAKITDASHGDGDHH